MAEQSDRKYNISQSAQPITNRTPAQKAHFFLEGKLYKSIKQDRAGDLLTAWDYEDNKLKQFLLSDAKKKMKPAYDTAEVARLINRNRRHLLTYLSRGIINYPQRIFSWGKSRSGKPFSKLKWSEDDILALHTYLLTLGSGRPRKDGTLYAATRIPSRAELLAMLRNQPMFYMKTADGEFVPVWSAYDGV